MASIRPAKVKHFDCFFSRYLCGGKEYWDNNGGANYVVECRSLNDDDGIKLV